MQRDEKDDDDDGNTSTVNESEQMKRKKMCQRQDGKEEKKKRLHSPSNGSVREGSSDHEVGGDEDANTEKDRSDETYFHDVA